MAISKNIIFATLWFFFIMSSYKFPVPHCNGFSDKVEHFNNRVAPLISEMRKTTFFRIFKVYLNEECTFWTTEKTCISPSCSVCPCEYEEIPEKWRKENLREKVNRSLRFKLNVWEEDKTLWIVPEDTADGNYIDLCLNPHVDTGFSGPSAWRVWKSIYGENCLNGKGECVEDKIFYRLISGMHTSVSAHIAAKSYSNDIYRMDFSKYRERLEKFPERIENLYFAYTFLLKSIGKAEKALSSFPIDTGNSTDDTIAKESLLKLLKTDGFKEILGSFDETILFGGNLLDPRLSQYKAKFRKISRILNCVECEKCLMYGKLQILGMGTALKITFDGDGEKYDFPSSLSREEVMALLMTFAEFSDSIKFIEDFRRLKKESEIAGWLMLLLCSITVSLLPVRRWIGKLVCRKKY